jgi:hypothetical protein
MTTPYIFDKYSALDRAIGKRVTRSFNRWLAECERHDTWHELPDAQSAPTIKNIAAFLDDYADFQKEEA